MLVNYLSSIISFSPELTEQLKKLAKDIQVSKGSSLMSIGKSCTHLYFIEAGLIRGYYFVDGKEITNWFAQENEFATCFYSFVTRSNTYENVEAITDCVLKEISFEDLQTLYLNFPETERIGRIITENYYIKLEERLLSIQFKTAKERYAHLMEKKSSLLLRAPLGQIASYLGITQETLSRIRAEV